MQTFRKVQAFVNLSHVASNLDFLRGLAGVHSFFCPMVKANAYGHGDREVAQFLQQRANIPVGVGQIEEGLRLRQAGLAGEILCFSHFDESGAEAIVEHSLSPVLMDRGQIELLQNAVKKLRLENPYPVHLKFDSGMNRMGFGLESVSELVSLFAQNPGILKVKTVLTHLLKGEDAANPDGVTGQQLRPFLEVVTTLQSQKKIFGGEMQVHALNSAALLQKKDLEAHLVSSFDLGARPGLSIYGYSPLTGLSSFLRPVLSLKAHWVNLRFVKKGSTVSYGGTWTAWQDSWIGVLPYGYADGYSRRLSNRSSVLCLGFRAAVVGNICMDYMMVDATEIVNRRGLEQVQAAAVTILGEDESGNILGAHELANLAGTAPWEILTSVAERIPRTFVRDQVNS